MHKRIAAHLPTAHPNQSCRPGRQSIPALFKACQSVACPCCCCWACQRQRHGRHSPGPQRLPQVGRPPKTAFTTWCVSETPKPTEGGKPTEIELGQTGLVEKEALMQEPKPQLSQLPHRGSHSQSTMFLQARRSRLNASLQSSAAGRGQGQVFYITHAATPAAATRTPISCQD
jgi:hypothetical protein